MSSYFDDASLVMIPSGYKTSKVYSVKPTDGSGDLTFSRSNDTATRVASNGLIEKVRTNLILQSNSFSTTWVNTRSTDTSGQAGYDGTNNAWLLESTSSPANESYIRQTITASGSNTFSIYAKAGTSNFIAFYLDATAGTDPFAFFNLSTGAVASTSATATASIVSVGSGWYRCSATFNATIQTIDVYVTDANGSFNSTSGANILIQAAQLETGDIATDYIATTTAAVSVGPVANVPRLDYLNSSCPRLLLEPQRQNVITFSEQLDNAAWNKETGNTVVANSVVSPDGYTNADSISASSGNVLNVNQALPLPASTTSYTFSGFFKKQSSSSVEIYLFQIVGGFVARASINLDAGTITASAGTATITNYGNGWYRASVTGTLTGSIISTCGIFNESTTGTRNVYAYGCQVEASAAYATSYIPTLGAAVTRGADACSKTGISSLTSASEYTIYWEGTHIPTGQYNSFATFYNNANNNDSTRFYRNNTNNEIRAAFFNSATGLALDLASGVTTQTAKCAVRVKAGSYALYVNGALVNSSTSSLAPASNIDAVNLQYFSSGQSFDQKTGQVLFFKTALSNADLAALTA